MIKVMVIFDDCDSSLGEFFTSFYYDLLQFFQKYKKHFAVTCINGENLDKQIIEDCITNFNQVPFLCLSYSHGIDRALLHDETRKEYINQHNSYFFGNSFFYTVSCKTGKELGKMLIQNGCKAFIGYEERIHIAAFKEYELYFMKCANYGIKQFFTGKTALEIYLRMIEKYDDVLDFVEKKHPDDFLLVAQLRRNRDALVLLGNESLTIKDFR